MKAGLVVVLGLAALAAAGCYTSGPEPNLSLERMKDQPKRMPYESSPVFADGMAMRDPPEGAVPRERQLAPAGVVSGHDAGRWLARLPYRIDRAGIERGRQRFEIICGACHGPLADGNTPVARAMRLRKPPSLLEPRIRALPAGRIFYVIGHGYGFMPSYAADLTIAQRWEVVAYLEVLQWSRSVPLAELPAAERQAARSELERERLELDEAKRRSG